ncbi:MAG: hypothetical protein QME78_03935 [Thermodesulfobacteriota bacterium]|nr:hypothetical protein [Thermodesulfobacteriota bacterium]
MKKLMKPFLTREELHQKFRDCAKLVLPEESIQEAIRSIESIEEVEDVQELIQIFCP